MVIAGRPWACPDDGVINGGSLMMSRNKVKYLVIEKESNDNIGPLGIRFHFFCQRDDDWEVD
jgi:hypothetical protein